MNGLTNPLGNVTLVDFLNLILQAVIAIATPIIILFIVYIGFRFVQHSAEGNAEELKKDRQYLLWALVGALVLLGAQVLSQVIVNTVRQLF